MLFALNAKAQQDSVMGYYTLKGITVSAPKNLNSYDFIERILEDSSFVKTYRNYRYYPHTFETELWVHHKDFDKDKGYINRYAKKHLAGDFAWVSVESEKLNGDLKKRNGDWKYYTIEMLNDLVFFENPRKVSLKYGDIDAASASTSRVEKHKTELKKMLFSPGTEINSVPLIGKKMAIFNEEMAKYYDYKIWETTLGDTLACYGFSILAHDSLPLNKTVIKEMTSYFNKENFDLIKRSYRLVQNTMVYDFDVTISVENRYVKNILLPFYISYLGNWKIPFNKREVMQFELNVNEYNIDL
jgi:hypothetical protein